MTTGDAEEITFNVLPQEARDYLKRVSSDPKLAAECLRQAGITDENGELAYHYRPDRKD
jgi:hypothetical protein